MEPMTPCRTRACLGVLCLPVFLLGLAMPVRAQLRHVHPAEILPAGQVVQFFFAWEGPGALDGVEVMLPPGWTLEAARAVRADGAPVVLAVHPHPDRAGAYVVTAPRSLRGAAELILRARTGAMPGGGTWQVTPLVYRMRAGDRVLDVAGVPLTVPVHTGPAYEGDNRAFALAPGATGPLVLRRRAVPDLSLAMPFTVEFWVRTVGLDEVVLSTWDGDEEHAYPLEVVVDGRGRLMAFYGRPGRHHALAATRPLADGRWHHVAVTNAPDDGWLRLYLDGLAADSLFHDVPPRIGMTGGLALGGRLPRPGVPNPLFSGALDEVRLWPVARTRGELDRTRHTPLRDGQGPALVLGFDGPVPIDLLEGPLPALQRRVPGPDFYLPVRNLRGAFAPEGITLTWETEDRQTEAFLVERSEDGRSFDEVGRLEVGAVPGTSRFSFFDPEPGHRVLYYRIRQRFRDGRERISGTVKIGMGAERDPEADLIGNFPNPFNPSTTVAYSLRSPQHVRLTVWDLSGQLVAVLVDETQEAGYHEVPFHAGDLPSGTYFLRLQVAGEVQARQMILMK